MEPMKLSQQNNYIVYKHTFPNGKVYIGATSQKPNYRWKNGRGYIGSTRMENAIKKYGWKNVRHEILITNLTKEEAEQKERELIVYYNSYDKRYGYNLEKGGSKGKEISEETKEKLSKALSGENNPMYGKTYTLKQRQLISKRTKGENNPMYGKRGKDNPNYGRHLTEEQKQKLSKIMNSPEVKKKISDKLKGDKNPMKNKVNAMKCGATHKKKVICVETGIIYNSLKEASEKTNINVSCISCACKGRQKTAGGYHWEYYIDKAS